MAQSFNVLSNKKETNADIYNNTDEPLNTMLLEQWKYYEWYHNDGYICPNPQNIHQQEWTLKYELRVIISCQCRFILNGNKCPTLVPDIDSGGGCICGERRWGLWKLCTCCSVLLWPTKAALKNKVYQKLWTDQWIFSSNFHLYLFCETYVYILQDTVGHLQNIL